MIDTVRNARETSISESMNGEDIVVAEDNDDSYGFKDGWWFYVKSFLFNPYTIFNPKREEENYEPEF